MHLLDCWKISYYSQFPSRVSLEAVPGFSRGTPLVLYEHIFIRALTWGSEMGFGSLENLLMAYLR